MSRWFRHYAGMVDDDKLADIAVGTGQTLERVAFVWSKILESAAEKNSAGAFCVSAKAIAYRLRCETQPVADILREMESCGLIKDERVAKWVERQFESDTSAARTRAYRERKQSCDVTVTSQPVTVTAPEAETETKAEQQEAAAPISRTDFNRIEHECRKAAGVETSPSAGLCNLAPILGLIDAGYTLERDILPALAARPYPKAGSWTYFVGQIQDFHDKRRRAAGTPPPIRIAPPPTTADVSDAQWRAWVMKFRKDENWPQARTRELAGPPPGEPGCKVPSHILREFDLESAA